MNEKDLLLLRQACALLQDVTPFTYDCGKICSACCCGGGSADGDGASHPPEGGWGNAPPRLFPR